MKESLREILNGYFKKTIPLLTTLFLVLIGFVPTHLPFSHFLRPDLALICLYFWVLYRLDLFGVLSVIVLGLVVDSLSGAPFGMNICVLVFAYILTITYGSYVNTKPFLISWIGFAIVCFLALLFKWVSFSIYYKTFLSFGHILMSYLVSILIYPFIAQLNIFIQNAYLKDEEVINE